MSTPSDTQDDVRETPVSVVIPFCEAYTPRSMLEEAVESARAQAVPTEIIVVEDSEQRGPAWARNRGVDRADMQYVAFLDADDLWRPDKLQRQLAKMKAQDAGLCVEGHDMETEPFIRELLYGSLVSLTPSIVIDRRHVDVRFSEDLERYEDHLFMVEAACQGGVCLCPDLIVVRKHESGMSASGSPDVEYDARLELADRIESRPEMRAHADEVRRHAAYKYGRQLQRAGKWREGLRLLRTSIRYGMHARGLAALALTPYYALRALTDSAGNGDA